MHFQYHKVNGRLCSSIRHQVKTNGHGKNVDNDAVFKVEIERALPLNVLMKMYPYDLKQMENKECG